MLTQSLDSALFHENQRISYEKKRKRLSDEYKRIQKPKSCFGYIAGRNHPDKNRYSDVVPLDDTRVVLEDLTDDYINASHINLIFGDYVTDIISTQAPLTRTARDFWKMVWDQQTSVIIMLTNFQPYQAHKYFKENGTKTYKYSSNETTTSEAIEIQVTMIIKTSVRLGIIRVFNVSVNEEVRKIYHFQYTEWGDHREPKSVEDIKSLIGYMEVFQAIGTKNGLNGPTVVHCSAGIGRAGTFITCSILKQLHLFGIEKDISEVVTSIRDCRTGMVQTNGQYQFTYEFIESFN